VSTFTGEVYAEAACANLMATVQLMDCETSASIVSGTVTLVAPAAGSLIWTFTTSVEAPNNFGYYCGALSAFDTVNEADISDAETDCALWSPPCYLEVVNFGKIGQEESLDHMKTHLDYNIELAAHGDNACNTTTSIMTLQNGTADSFRLFLSPADLESALTTSGWNMSIAIESDLANGATVIMKDDNAVVDATAPALGFVTPPDVDCSVIVHDFCLETVTQVSSAGRYAFNFTI